MLLFDRSCGLEGVYIHLIFFKFVCLYLIFFKYGRTLVRSYELFVFVMSSMSRKQHVLQPFEDTLSVASQCSIFHELKCVGTVYKVLQYSQKALKTKNCKWRGAFQSSAGRRGGVPGCRCTCCLQAISGITDKLQVKASFFFFFSQISSFCCSLLWP